MMNDYDLEKFLENIPRPQVIVGHHRCDLKARLLNSPQIERKNMNAKHWKWAIAVCCGLVLLAGAGWAVQEIKIVRKTFGVRVEEQLIMPTGSTETVVAHENIVTFDKEDATQEKAEQVDRVVRQILPNLVVDIAKGNYKLVEVKELDSGELCYIYHFTSEDGSVSEYSSKVPLPETPIDVPPPPPPTDSQTE